jgi:alkylation response protein AidB-like acyl-CoA dehydrogenase
MGSLESFRSEVREWLAENCVEDVPVGSRDRLARERFDGWVRALGTKGWAAPGWPTEYGGGGLDREHQAVLSEEMRAIRAPAPGSFGLTMLGPTLLELGTDEQKREHLPPICRHEIIWCQGYSEPGAGSDLAGLQTRAVRKGDEYAVTGQKIWTTGAPHADWIFCLVRTEPDVQQQKGISFMLIDLNSPGIQIEPLYAFNGKRLWNQVFLDEVRVPAANRLGEENRGWTVAKSLLGDERLMVSRVSENKRLLGRIQEILQQADGQGIEASVFSARMAALDIRLQALEMTSLRILSQADSGQTIGAEPSMLKLKGSELVQAMDELLFEVIGYWALPQDRSAQTDAAIGPDYAEYIASGRYHHRGYTIAGGSSEVQHNIIAKQVLGL